jgi:hypothetical protein
MNPVRKDACGKVLERIQVNISSLLLSFRRFYLAIGLLTGASVAFLELYRSENFSFRKGVKNTLNSQF